MTDTVKPAGKKHWADSVKWMSLHGWLDLAQEFGLVTAGIAAWIQNPVGGLSVALVSVIGALPDMGHSYFAGKYGDGSKDSADKSAELEAQGLHEDPQTRYEKAIVCLGYVLAHKNPLVPIKMTDEAHEYAVNVLKESKGLLFMKGFPYLNVKDYPNEAGRSMEGIGKIIQSMIGIPAMSIDLVGGSLQTISGLMNVAAVSADFVPEKGENEHGTHLVQYLSGRISVKPEDRNPETDPEILEEKPKGFLSRAFGHVAEYVHKHPQKVAGGIQLASSFVLAAAATQHGLNEWWGKALLATSLIGMAGYGAKVMASKRGQSLEH